MAKKKLLDNKQTSVEKALKICNTAFPDSMIGTIHTLQFPEIKRFSSGSIAIDEALGGGYPYGRIIEMFGDYSTGKSTYALHAIKSVQEAGGLACFLDVEHALDVDYAASVGVDMDALLISKPLHAEDALEKLHILINTGEIRLIVIDSVAAMVPRQELEGNMGDTLPAMQARLMSQALRKITGAASKNNCTLIFTNQTRMKIGVVYGSPLTTAGGNALPFYSSIRMHTMGGEKVEERTDGEMTRVADKKRVKIIKNKTAPPHREAIVTMRYGYGIDDEAEVLVYAIKRGLAQKKGSWYAIGGENIAQGEVNAVNYLRDNPKIFEELKERVSNGEYEDVEDIEKIYDEPESPDI